jgi:hypothetical protein
LSYTELKLKEVKVRKTHYCEWCAEKLEIGQSAKYRAYVFDNEFHSGYMHPECHDAMQEADEAIQDEGWMPGDFSRGSSFYDEAVA